MSLLQKETELQEIVQLVGPDALPESEKVILEVARMLREDFLQQFAFDEVDAYCPPEEAVLDAQGDPRVLRDAAEAALNRGVSLRQILELPVQRRRFARMKNTAREEQPNDRETDLRHWKRSIARIEVL